MPKWSFDILTEEGRIGEPQLVANLLDGQVGLPQVEAAYQQLLLAQRSIERAQENLRLNGDYYRAGTSRMSDLLEAQMLYQQSCDKHTDAFADYQMKLLEYRQTIGQGRE